MNIKTQQLVILGILTFLVATLFFVVALDMDPLHAICLTLAVRFASYSGRIL